MHITIVYVKDVQYLGHDLSEPDNDKFSIETWGSTLMNIPGVIFVYKTFRKLPLFSLKSIF